MLKHLLLAGALLAGTCLAADKTVTSRDSICQISVPADWVSEALPGLAHSSDKKMTVAVSSPRMIDSFAQLKQNARNVYKESKVTKDSGSEFEMEGKSMGGKPDVYRAIPASGGKFCIAEVTYQSGTADDAKRIVETLKPGK